MSNIIVKRHQSNIYLVDLLLLIKLNHFFGYVYIFFWQYHFVVKYKGKLIYDISYVLPKK